MAVTLLSLKHTDTQGVRSVCAESTTFAKNNSFVGWKLGLNRLSRQILSAFPKISLGAAQTPEPPEVGPVSAGSFGERVLNTGQLLGSAKRR